MADTATSFDEMIPEVKSVILPAACITSEMLRAVQGYHQANGASPEQSEPGTTNSRFNEGDPP